LNEASERELKFVADKSPVEGLKVSLLEDALAVWLDPVAETNTGK
jgi:hypothetical protein